MIVVPDPIGDVDALAGEQLVAEVTLDSGAGRVETYDIQLATRSAEDSPAWDDPRWEISDGPLEPKPVVRFITLNGCRASKGMIVGSRLPTVQLAASQDIASYRWELRQHGEVIDSAGDGDDGVSDDRRCIVFTPKKRVARRGTPSLGFFFPPFDRRDGLYNGRTYGKDVVPSGLPHHAYSVDFNKKRGDDAGRPVLAAASGTVDSVNLGDGTVKIKHWNRRLMTQYTHMQNITVEAGDRVELLQPIGEIGAVGTVSPHLHHVHLRHDSQGRWVPRKMRFGKIPYKASLAGRRIPSQNPADWRAPDDVGAPDNVLFGRDYRGWLTEPDALFKVWVRLADGRELRRRLRFLVAKSGSRFPACHDPGCEERGIAPDVQIDREFDGDEPEPGEYSLRYRVTDNDGAVSDWAYDHSVVISGDDSA